MKKRAKPVNPRAVVYARISDIGDERTASLESQSAGARAMAVADGYKVDDEDVIYERFTGAELYDRPKLNELRAQVKSGYYQAVYCHDLDRLSRQPVHQLILAEEFTRNECDLKFVLTALDSSPESQLIQFVKGYAANLEREKIRERTMRGKKMTLDRGMLLCMGTPKYGYSYDRERKCRVIDEEAAKWVTRIFEWTADGMSMSAVARSLNASGIPTPYSHNGVVYKDGRVGRWGHASVSRLVTDRSYTGRTTMDMTRSSGKYKNGYILFENVDEAEWRVMDAALTPRIISDELFESAQTKIRGHNGADRTRNERLFYLLRGMVYCASCGRRMLPDQSNTRKDNQGVTVGFTRIYRCASRRAHGTDMTPCGGARLNADWVEAVAWGKVHELIADPEFRRAELARAGAEDSSRPMRDALESAKAVLAKETKIERRLYQAWVGEDDADFASRLQADHAASRARIRDIRKEIETIEARIGTADSGSLARVFEEVCEGIASRLLVGATNEQKRLACEALGLRVTGNKRDVVIQVDVGVLGHSSSSTIRNTLVIKLDVNASDETTCES